jgi:hypothetical protein
MLLAACADAPIAAPPAPHPIIHKLVPTGKSTCLDHLTYFEVERPNDYPVWLTLLRDGKHVPC